MMTVPEQSRLGTSMAHVVLMHLSKRKERDYVWPDQQYHACLSELIESIPHGLRLVLVSLQLCKVPHTSRHKHDFITTAVMPEFSRRHVDLLS